MWSVDISCEWYFKFGNTQACFFFFHQKIKAPYFALGCNNSNNNISFLFWSWGMTSIHSFIQLSSTTMCILLWVSVFFVKTFSFSTNKYFWSEDLQVWPNECKEIIQRETSRTDKKETESVAERFALRGNWKEESRAPADQFNSFLPRLLLNFDSTVDIAQRRETLRITYKLKTWPFQRIFLYTVYTSCLKSSSATAACFTVLKILCSAASHFNYLNYLRVASATFKTHLNKSPHCEQD